MIKIPRKTNPFNLFTLKKPTQDIGIKEYHDFKKLPRTCKP